MPHNAHTRHQPGAPSARERLQLSRLKLTQLELMGDDVDIESFKLEMWKIMPIDIIERITDASVERTTAGASTFQVDVEDSDRTLLRSGALTKYTDVEIDGLFWRLAQLKKQSDKLMLIFEEREIAVLRTYKKPIKATAATSRAQITRAEFILRLIREPYEFKHNPIPYVIPDLKRVEPIGLATTDQASNTKADHQRALGISPHADVTVKGVRAKPWMIKNANIILRVGAGMALPRPVLVMAIMCAIQESSITNLPIGVPGDFNYLGPYPDSPVGVFQQIPKWWKSKGGATRNVAKDAKAFFESASAAYSSYPQAPLWANVLRAQDEPPDRSIGKAYARWQPEAEHFVTAFGVTSTDQATANRQYAQASGPGVSSNYEFFRGKPPQSGQNIWLPEDSWSCITRLAQEVNWRAFFVSGTFYYLDDQRLFASKPRAHVTEGQGGVDYIDFDYDEQKKVATVTVNCRIGRWNVPPGCIVELRDMGPIDGRWLVTDVTRSIFSSSGIVTLQKPQPQLPEPLSDSGSKSLSQTRGKKGSQGSGADPNTGYANPFPDGWRPNRLDMGWDGTFSGKLIAPFDGTITYAGYIGGPYPWGGYIVLKADKRVPGLPTHSLYFAEGVVHNLLPGATVRAGQVLGSPGPTPYSGPEGTIEWGVAEDKPVGTYSRPYAQQLGLGSSAARAMVKNFVGWAHQSLGVKGNPTQTSGAGNK